jgi:hypothetical protein
MKIDKAIFGVDDSYFMEFWPLQAKICKELLGIQPVLFYICEEDSDFYDDGYGLVKKIKKVYDKKNGDVIHTGLLACIARMYGTKYFPNDVCLTCDLDMLMINKEYFIDQIQNFHKDSLVIYSSDAYDLNRPEASELFKNEPFPFTQEMYNYPYNAAKGETFDKILDTSCSFEDFVDRHSNFKEGYKYMWMIDEFYFSDCVNNKDHGVEVHKLKRGYTSPWIADRRIERHNFPVNLEWEAERQNQKKFGVYDEEKLRNGYYIDVNCCRPYTKFKNEIDHLINIVLLSNNNNDMFELGIKHNTDKILYHRYDRIYDKFLRDFRNKKIKLFEIGCGGEAASFKMWLEFFPNANVYSMDISENFNVDRGEVFLGDQSKIEDLQNALNKVGISDIIIDDGSHHPQHQLNTFLFLFDKMLNNGGVYIIEDIECNYWKQGTEIYGYPIGNLNIVDFFSSTPHQINQEFSGLKNNLNISSITYYKNCIILVKKTLEELIEDKREYRFKEQL